MPQNSEIHPNFGINQLFLHELLATQVSFCLIHRNRFLIYCQLSLIFNRKLARPGVEIETDDRSLLLANAKRMESKHCLRRNETSLSNTSREHK